jgi:hypothetical protein
LSPIFARPSSPSPLGIAYRAPLLSGEAGTAQTVQAMRQLVDQAVSDQNFVRTAVDIVRGAPAYNDIAEASRVYDWVSRNIRYTKDPVTKEKLYPPKELLKIRAGDCDDIAMLMGALMIALGYPARLITISANEQNPQEFSHVYLEAEVPPGSGQWVPMDAARPGAQFGIEPPMYFRKRAWSLTDDSFQDLSGCCEECSVGSLKGCGGLAGYVGGTLGQDGTIDWNAIIQQGLQEIPSVVAVSTGQSSNANSPYGSVATGPYASFATPYTPGAGVPAGYSISPTTGQLVATGTLSAGGSIMPWLLGLGALLLFMGRR